MRVEYETRDSIPVSVVITGGQMTLTKDMVNKKFSMEGVDQKKLRKLLQGLQTTSGKTAALDVFFEIEEMVDMLRNGWFEQ